MNILEFLASVRLFEGLSTEVLASLAREAGQLELPAGGTLMHRGEIPGDVYLLQQGRLRSVREDINTNSKIIDDIAPGEFVGEMAFLSKRPRTSTVKALRDSHLIRFSGETFKNLERDRPAVVIDVMRTAFNRVLYGPNDPHRVRQRTFAVVALGDSRIAREVAGAIAEALSIHGSTRLLTREILESWLESGDIDQFERRLDAEEEKNCFVLFEADSRSSKWMRRCIRHGDSVLLVLDPQSIPQADPFGSKPPFLGEGDLRKRVEIIMAHDGDWGDSRVMPWSDQFEIAAWHHLRRRNSLDIQRIARHLAGQAQGIVFSGGGARGYAHLGVIKALKEARIPLDAAGGTSFGSLAAASVALDWPVDRIWEVFRSAFSTGGTLYDFTPPIVSLTRGKRLNDCVRDRFDHGLIEDLRRPFFCISTNLSKGQMKIHTRGKLWRALRASVSIPGIFPPQIQDGEILVDGAFVNNLPVDVMDSWVSKTGRILAVDIASEGELSCGDLDDSATFSGWRFLGRKFNPLLKSFNVPTLPGQLLRLTQIADNLHRDFITNRADILIRPPVDRFGALDWTAFDDLTQLGYEFTMRQLEKGIPDGIITE